MAGGINLGSAYGSIDIGTDGAKQQIQSLSDTLKGTGQALSLGVTAPLVGAAAAAIKFSNDLNSGMANVASLGVASARVTELKASVQATAMEVGKSTDDMAKGLYQTVSAFGDTSDTAEILRINAKSAAAGLAETTDAIALTSAVTKGYGDTTAAAVQKASDLALKTVALGQTTFPELAASIGTVTPLAANLGVKQEELFAVMATGTGVTGNAAAVSTQLRGVMQALMAPTANMVTLQKQLGYSSSEAMLKGMGLQGTMAAITAAAKKSGQPLQSYLGSIEGQTLALAMSGPLADQYTDKLKAMGDAAGATDEAFKAQTQGINKAGFSMQQARIKFEVMMQKIGDGLAPALGAVMDAIQPLADQVVNLADAFANAGPTVQMVVVGIAAAAAAAGPLMIALSGVGAVLGLLASPVALVAAAVAALAAAWMTDFAGIRSVTMDALSGAQGAIDGARTAMQGLYDIFVRGEEPMGDWSVWWETMAGSIGEGAASIIEDVAGMGKDIGDAFKALASGDFSKFNGVLSQLQADFDWFVQDITGIDWGAAFAPLAEWLDGKLPGATDALKAAWTAAWPAMQNAVTAAWSGIAGALLQAWGWLQVALPAAVAGLRNAWETAWPAMQAAVGTAWSVISGALAGAWAWLQVALPAALGFLRGAWETAWPAMQAAVGTAWTAISGALAGAWAWLQVALPLSISTLQTMWNTAWPAIQTALQTAWGVIQPALAAAWAWLQVALPLAVAALQNAWNTAWPAIQTALQTAWGVIQPALAAAWAWLQVALPLAVNALKTVWETAWPAIQAALSAAWTAIKPIFDAIGGFVGGVPEKVTALQGSFGTLGEKLSSIGTTLQTAFAPSIERVQTAFTSLPEKLAPLQPKLDALGAAFNKLVQAVQPLIMLVGAALAVAAMVGVNLFAAVMNNLPAIIGPIIDQVTATINMISTTISSVVTVVKAIIAGDWATAWASAKDLASTAINFIRDTFLRMGNLLAAIIKAACDAVLNTLKDLGVDVPGVLNTIQSTWESIWNKIKDALAPVEQAIESVKSAIDNFKTWLGGISLPNPFAPLADAWNAIAAHLPGAQTGNAAGTSYFAGGVTAINERGYEAVALPAGSRVYTNGQTNNLPKPEPRQISINFGGVTITKDMDVQLFGLQLQNILAAQMGA